VKHLDKEEMEKLKRPAAGQKGFTVVELAVVIVLLLLIVVPMALSIDESLRTSNEVYRLTAAAFLAQQKMEEVRTRASCYTTDWGAPAPINCSPANVRYNLLFNFSQNPPCSFPVPFQDFECQVVYAARVGANNYIREIQVRVWYDQNNNDTWDSNESDVIFQTAITYHSPAWFN